MRNNQLQPCVDLARREAALLVPKGKVAAADGQRTTHVLPLSQQLLELRNGARRESDRVCRALDARAFLVAERDCGASSAGTHMLDAQHRASGTAHKEGTGEHNRDRSAEARVAGRRRISPSGSDSASKGARST